MTFEYITNDLPQIEVPFTAPPQPIDPLFASMLRRAVQAVWGSDPVMTDFVAYVIQPLSDLLGHKAAKGGAFAADRRALGEDTRRYDYDQTMRGHLINGLFPVLHVAKTLKGWDAPQFRYYDNDTCRLFVAGFLLHDWLKLPGVEAELEAAGFSHNDSIGPAQLSQVETLFKQWGQQLGMEAFLQPLGGLDGVLHELIYIACNTQIRWGTLRNLSVLDRLNPKYRKRLGLCEQMSRLADYLTYIARKPGDVAAHPRINDVLQQLSQGQAQFTTHHLADNLGVLTNFIQQSLLEALSNDRRVPVMYTPSGVVYLTHREAGSPPPIDEIVQATIERVKAKIRRRLFVSLTGFKRDGKGLKFADYYWSFFDVARLIEVGTKATFSIINEGKKPSAGKRFTKMATWFDLPDDLPDDVRVDQLAEWCYFVEKAVAAEYSEFDTAKVLLESMNLASLTADFEAVPRDTRAGGVGYHWYFAAGLYLREHSQLDPTQWRERIEQLAKTVIAAMPKTDAELAETQAEDPMWRDFRAYMQQTVSIDEAKNQPTLTQADFAVELHRYQNAKRKGRGRTEVCALRHSPFAVNKQQEAAVLFAPQVYSNRLSLHGSAAIRNISSIAGLEMMLRQLFMNPTKASGGDVENQRMRYLFFYPTYFFTPETLRIIKEMNDRLNKPSFTELRKFFVKGQGLDTTVDLSPATLQRLEPYLLTLDPDKNRDMRFSDTEPQTFCFIGIQPPGREAKDAEAWVHPAFLALLLPLCLDVKVVASEASLPLLTEAEELPETVLLDAPHAFVRYLTQPVEVSRSSTGPNGLAEQPRFNIDQLLPTLQRLIVSYLIQMDANSGMGRAGFDYRWQDIPAVARNLSSSPLYAFYYLKKWQRKDKLDTLPVGKAALYLEYVTYLERSNPMSHARELTQLYRQFYRAKKYNANSIVRPLSLTTKIILEADPRLFPDPESLRELVFAELQRRINKLQQDGLAFYPKGSTYETRNEAMEKFATYLVDTIYYGAFRGDKSALRGKQLNMLSSACESIYRVMQAEEKKERGEAVEEVFETETK